MKSLSESKKGELLIRGASTLGIASGEPPGRPDRISWQENEGRRMAASGVQSGHGFEPQRHGAHRGAGLCVLGASVVNFSCGRGGEMKSLSERRKGERLICGASTSGLASEEPPGRPGNGWRGLSGLDSGS